jgi:hypothetical protein
MNYKNYKKWKTEKNLYAKRKGKKYIVEKKNIS